MNEKAVDGSCVTCFKMHFQNFPVGTNENFEDSERGQTVSGSRFETHTSYETAPRYCYLASNETTILPNKLEIMKELVVVASFTVPFLRVSGVRIDTTPPTIKYDTPKALPIMLTCFVPIHEKFNYRTRGTGLFPHFPVLPLVVPWIVTLCFLTACV